jgi:excisionase family DNA binding protein
MKVGQEWMSPKEFQEWLGIGKTKCYEILSRQEIPSYRIGRISRIKKADIEHWLESNRFVPGD